MRGEEGLSWGTFGAGKTNKNGVMERFQAEKLYGKEKLAIFAAVFSGKLRK